MAAETALHFSCFRISESSLILASLCPEGRVRSLWGSCHHALAGPQLCGLVTRSISRAPPGATRDGHDQSCPGYAQRKRQKPPDS